MCGKIARRLFTRRRRKDGLVSMMPLSDASRRPKRFPVATVGIILLNAHVFLLELYGGEAFVKQWAVI